jgi:fumarylacetoacetate (FAA) hydrolase
VKLCRFELASAPGYQRSGIVYTGKVYETDGEKAVAIHEWSDIIPLAPLGKPPSVRVFHVHEATDDGVFPFSYLNPASMHAPNQPVAKPDFTDALDFEPYLAVVVAQPGSNLSVEEADAYILGIAVVVAFVARDIEREERRAGAFGRSRDFAMSVGPLLTTPEELDDAVVDDQAGRRYRLNLVARINGEEVLHAGLADLPISLAQAISYASESCELQPGDLILIGPAEEAERGRRMLDHGDELQVAFERLGTLNIRIT